MQDVQPGSRSLFPTLEARSYLNHAAISPPSAAVVAAVRATIDGYAREGAAWYGHEMRRRDRVRSMLAELLGVHEPDVALVANTSAGVSHVALCLPWQRGDRVVLLRGEFPTNVTPWQQAARARGLEIAWLDAERFRLARREALDELREVLRRGARLVAISAVQFATGQRMPIEEIGAMCREAGSELFVDGIQAAGVVPLSLAKWGVTYFAAGGHKWLMGLEGTGALWIDPNAAARMSPVVAGWLSHDEPFGFLFDGPGHLRYDRPIVQTARFVEAGAPNAVGLAALEASLQTLLALRVERIAAHIQRWHDALEPALLQRGFHSARMAEMGGRSGILSLRPPDSAGARGAPQWAAKLAEHGVACACPDGWLRLAPHWPNSLDEVALVIDAVDAILAGRSHK